MSTTVATLDVGGTGANNAAEARVNLGVTSINLGVTNYNFVNTETVTVTVTETTAGNANVSLDAAGLPSINIVESNTVTAIASNHYILGNSLQTIVTLPSSPVSGDVVWITVSNGRVDNTVDRNSANINSIAEDLIIDNAYAGIQLRYADATKGWVFS